MPLFQKSRDLVERLMPAHYVPCFFLGGAEGRSDVGEARDRIHVGMGSLVHIIVFYIYVLIKFIIHIYVLIPHIYIYCVLLYIYTTLYILIYNINYTIYIYLYWFGQCISECHLGRNFMLDL